jgi:hypothetical protein
LISAWLLRTIFQSPSSLVKIRTVLDPANKQQVIQMLTSEYHLAPEIADEYYQTSFNGHGGYAKDAQFDP